MTSKSVHAAMLSVSAAALLTSALVSPVLAQTPQIDADDIAGTVMGAGGPEAGVWVVAETRDLPTSTSGSSPPTTAGDICCRICPSELRHLGAGIRPGRFAEDESAPGKALDLKAVRAPNEAAAAEYYPAIYWWSMLKIPEAKTFPGTGPSGNGIPVTLRDQGLWLRYLKTDGCNACHQLGDKSTRMLPTSIGHFDNSAAAWERRIQSGQAAR